MTTKLLNREPALDNIRQFGLFDDFQSFNTGDDWTSLAASATVAASDTLNGNLVITTAGADNDEGAVYSTKQLFKMYNNLPLVVVARAQIDSPSQAYGAAMSIGLMDGIATDFIVDNDGGPAAGKHLCAFHMASGTGNGRNLGVYSVSSAAGTYQATSTEITISDSDWNSYMITVEPISTTEKRISFFFDADGGQNWKKLKDSNGNVITHKWTLSDPAAGTGEMNLYAGCKSTSAEAQVMNIDYLGAWQLRKSYPATGVSTD